MTEYSPAKTGEYPRIFHHFQNCMCCEKDLKDNKHDSLHTENMLGLFDLGHYLFLIVHSFPWAVLSKNWSLLRTDKVRGQISQHIFATKWRLLFIYTCMHVYSINYICSRTLFTFFCCFRPRARSFYSQLKRAVKLRTIFIMPGHYKKILPTRQPIRAQVLL